MAISVVMPQVKPAAMIAQGRNNRPNANMTSGWRTDAGNMLFELLEALAHQSAPADQQHQHHQQVHGGLGSGGVEEYGDPSHHTNQQPCEHDTPEGAEAADHDHYEGGGKNLASH